MINKKWECFLCCREDDFKIPPVGFLSNYHPLCRYCADSVLQNRFHRQYFRLTYHESLGDIVIASNIPILTGSFLKN